MGRTPGPNEWGTSALPEERTAYLNSGRTFEEITDSLVTGAEVHGACVEPCIDQPPIAPPLARRIRFQIVVNSKAYDLFYNAPDGLRGRYWQGPDIGFLATRHLIDKFRPKL